MAIPLILGPIVSLLADKGLDLMSKAIEGGADKAVDFVKEKTGIDLAGKSEFTSAEIIQLKQLEKQDKVRLEELALESKKEDNRHEEAMETISVTSTSNAQNMNVRIQESDNASWLAKNAAYMIDFFVISATVILSLILMYSAVPKENLQIVNIMFGSFLTFVGTIIAYHRGSSHSSQKKDAHINRLTGGRNG